LLCGLTLLAASCAPAGDSEAGDGPLSALSADSADVMAELRFLADDELEGRRTGTPGAARAAGFLAAGFAASGLAPFGGVRRQEFTWIPSEGGEPRAGTNVLGSRLGAERPGRVIVVSAHYDHVGVRNGEIYNGADDNASGAVGLLALARALRARPLRHTVVFAAFDGEEAGLRGARAFVRGDLVPTDSIAIDLNLDMIARTHGVLWAGGAAHTPALRPVLEAVAAQSPVELRLGHDRPGAPEGDDWTNASDHGAFHETGIPFVYLGVEDHPDYHRPTDDFENVDAGEYMDALRVALLILLALDQALPFDTGTGS
jgi:Zn-dependent M28 family amino/carboxypeptidase